MKFGASSAQVVRSVSLLTALGRVPCHHIANPLRMRCYTRVIASPLIFAMGLQL